MSRRSVARYLHLEAESGSEEEYESSEFSEDLDNVLVHPPRATQSFRDVTREIESKYMIDSSEEEEEEEILSEESLVEAPGQGQLLPTPHSPLLFMVRCKPGKEKDICLRILDNAKNKEICSIIHKDGLRGYIYIESYKKQVVEDVLLGIKNVFRRRIGLVPFKEMVDAISFKKNYIVSDFARVKGGKYKGDLVQILENYEDMVKVKLIPRIDGSKKYFNPAEHRNNCVEKDGGYVFNRDFYQDGFLVKTMLKSNLDFEVDPTFAELDGLKIKGKFDINDHVKVIRGDLTNFTGKIEHISSNSVTVTNDNKRYEVNAADIVKYYSSGDEVSFNGVNGIVLNVEGSDVVVGVHNLTEEIKCKLNDLKPPVTEKREFREQSIVPRGRRDPQVNRKVIVSQGDYKGLEGIVKDIYRNKCRVQLSSTLEFINIDRNSVTFVDDPYSFKRQRISRPEGDTRQLPSETPGYKTPGYQTPGYQTPGYKTPGYQTPGYKTPGYKTPGYQTPGYKTPGYQTPGYKTPGFNSPSSNPNFKHRSKEATGTEWLSEKTIYEGILVKSGNEIITISDIKNGKLYSRDGKTYNDNMIEYVMPEKYDIAFVMRGTHKDVEGALVSINGDECMIRDSKNGECFTVQKSNITKKSN